MWTGSLCASCRHLREVTSSSGSVFWMCTRAASDPRFRKYPSQPVLRCAGAEVRAPDDEPEAEDGRDADSR